MSQINIAQDNEIAVHIGSLRPTGEDSYPELHFNSRKYGGSQSNQREAMLKIFLTSEIESANGLILV